MPIYFYITLKQEDIHIFAATLREQMFSNLKHFHYAYKEKKFHFLLPSNTKLWD